MEERLTKPFGLWPSPLTPRSMSAGKRLSDVHWDTDGETLVWLEGRSDQGVLVTQRGDGAPRDLTVEQSVRAKVGYGGGDFTVAHGAVYFADAATGRLYRQELSGGTAQPITPPFGAAASPRVSPDGQWVLYVHHDDERRDRLAVVKADGTGWPHILVQGHDFYTQPRWSPDGRHVAFVAWNHPEMPWDGAALLLAKVDVTEDVPHVTSVKTVAGDRETSVFQPEFAPDGTKLYYVEDSSGFWQLTAVPLQADGSFGKPHQITQTKDAEYGMPNWVQDMRTYQILPDGLHAICAVNKRGFIRLHLVSLSNGEERIVEAASAYTDVSQISVAPTSGCIAFVASASGIPLRVVTLDSGATRSTVVARSHGETIPEAALAKPEAITWRTAGDEDAHGLFYKPMSTAHQATGKPPLIVIVHGGPTAQARAGWSAQAQFFTTRGYAVLMVNHRGSTGYGRAYMLKLRGKWGQLDVEDSVSGARHLATSGLVDGHRTVIMGGSAGGYTVLQTMVDHPDAFTAGICLYGIANQFTLVQDTHKFEERYSDSLLGKLPEAAALYRERSPLFKAAKIKRPLAIFQGEKDKVVPQDQSDQIVKALQRAGTPHVYHVYAGEGHGWRKAETIQHFYTAVDAFLREHLIFS